MSFCEHISEEGWSDWELAHLKVHIRSLARYGCTLQAEVDPRMRLEFTAEEVRRIDAYLAASLPDTGRLTAIEKNRPGPAAVDDTGWLIEQLRIAWVRLQTLRDRLDDSGSLMSNSHVADAIGCIRGTRVASGFGPCERPQG
ncbi:hypothetical protein [Streptomyces atroolivaceus]|uniref:hypothetical protein n=1 Tax=Streptomyces atroolivaceus TaxID=66869 RepID=UPI00362F7BF4